jgi:signal peptidase I
VSEEPSEDEEAGSSRVRGPAPTTPEAAKAKAVREAKRRPPRQVRAAARILRKETTKILHKHAARIAAEPAEAMRTSLRSLDRLLADEDWPALEDEAEKLDELLHRHAAFARKGPLRETVENIGIAVMIALGLRTCLYEPFKIPSGSMMPTLRSGDHIFVNKFIYGIQLPFTTTVIGESWGEIERGDVIVFRFPLDQSEDFIKRVMGLPGDEIRVRGRQVALKRPGETEFTPLSRKRLEDRCFDEEDKKPIANCTLYEETSGDKTYVVRYLLSSEERGDLTPQARTWKVPEGHLLVMGDNRNRSHDSTAWTVTVEAVGADKILTTKDLRDLTEEQLFALKRPEAPEDLGDPHHDQIEYASSHRSPRHDLSLAVWRQPTLTADAVYEALARRMHGGKGVSLEALLADGELPDPSQRATFEGLVGLVGKLTVGADEDQRTAVVLLPDSQTVLSLSCGTRVCKPGAALGALIGEVLERFATNEQQDARSLLPQTRAARYTSEWTGRHDPRDHFFERVLAKTPDSEARDRVRLRAFRHPDESVELVRDAALAALGHTTDSAEAVAEFGNDAWLVTVDDAHVFVATDHARQLAVVLECGRGLCRAGSKATELAESVMARVPAAAGDRRKMKELLTTDDLEGLIEVTVPKPELYEFDRVRREATVKGQEHSLQLEAWLRPEGGLPAKVRALTDAVGDMEVDGAVGEDAWYAHVEQSHVFVIGVPDSETALQLRCFEGLCPDRATATALARRAATKALDASTFVDPQAERPRPFVPRGNVKGRAERIWLPFSRFWLPIR